MISILIPIYNGIEFIEESVSSVLNQTYEQWELLIGINGHPENSDIYKIAKEYEKKNVKIRVFDFYTIRGKSNTLNEMIPFCNYDYVAILDVDDVWHPQKLEVQSQLLNKFDVIGSNCVWFGDRPGIVPSIPGGDISNYDFSIVNPIINSSSLIRKELCYWKNMWDGVEDYDLWLRLRKQNKKFYNFKEILVKHRIHNTSAFNANGNNNKVGSLLVSHGFKSRKEIQNEPSRVQMPKINKIGMNLL
jgi:glycosyltransferase involved in cell wall biosynthesis